MSPFSTSAPEGMNVPSSSHRFTAMPNSLGDEVLCSSVDWKVLPVNDQGVAAMHDHEILIIVMHMRRG